MAEHRPPEGRSDMPVSGSEARLELAGLGVVVVWVLLVLVWGIGGVGGGPVFLIFAVALPLVMLALVRLLMRNLHELREQSAALAGQLWEMRKAEARDAAARTREAVAEEAAGRSEPAQPVAEVAVDEPVVARQPVASGVSAGVSAGPGFASRRDPSLSQRSADGRAAMAPPAPAAPDDDEPTLALATPPEAEAPPIEVVDFVRAIQFPESAEDAEGFAALRRVLVDRTAAKLIRASQDVLTLLAQEGIYMDNLVPDRARPELWRRFAAGERGRPVAALGGIRDRSSLALAGMKMRDDPVFRDAAHHFLRSFDRALAVVEPRASDAEMGALADTRTARAFMLLGRVAGTFD